MHSFSTRGYNYVSKVVKANLQIPTKLDAYSHHILKCHEAQQF